MKFVENDYVNFPIFIPVQRLPGPIIKDMDKIIGNERIIVKNFRLISRTQINNDKN